ncbi:MAG TPA: helix-turn-helix transcriptional regulator [Stellaceae bacterium]|jgi:transcriptional regulator with XRE-family HTH domain|nr:helix-turn-helix transcriptional regulator [Stellaceae bacterium]
MSVAQWDGAEAYIDRLASLRVALGYDSQVTFAEALGISFKRWNSYERGYPIPRETAWLLQERFGISADWLWWGKEGNMPAQLLKQIHERKRKP